MTATVDRAGVLERYEPVIGIEIHCQLRTASKMFCGCSNAYADAAPNTHVCPVCLALPGSLPVVNRRAVELVIATGIAIDATIPERTQWERKNYFYPDLPKGYQISQYAIPLAARGRLAIETSAGPFSVPITRAHLEEDTAKLIHEDAADGADGRASLVDFNRSGAPLMEIVTEPDIRTAEQARRYAEELQMLLRAIGASDADMERGQMRVEANVSLRPRGTDAFGTRVEVKNMNSFRAVERAIGYEIERQGAALDAGEPLHMETRGWDDARQATYRMRAKETSEDYRYFPDPDLPPLHVEPAWIDRVRAALPELPASRRARYEALGITPYDAAVLVADPGMTGAFEAISTAAGSSVPAREVSNFVSGIHARVAKASGYNASDTAGASTPAGIAVLLDAIARGTVSRQVGRDLLERHLSDGTPPEALLAGAGPGPISDDASLLAHVDAVIAANPKAVADHRAGKPVAGFFVGQVMKATGGAADASRVTTLVRERLDAGD
ncbi:MAG: aspartyl-tRNA(Asn)/glutamyl-tRNA(Gln) amidotransferase subunit [Chloroflexota bacterium]|nr:aspartyl-tRNA(Asn)/glutamyl-tRNA(Gln) amidotransferase subunit [Chloroflexota bacterium]